MSQSDHATASLSKLMAFSSGMYARTHQKWQEHAHELFDGACGYSILSGPPIYHPSLMIVGENPGFGDSDSCPHVELSWPDVSYITRADWPLAQRLRQLLGPAGGDRLFDNAIQTNFLFFKSSSLDRPSRYRWMDIDRALRVRLQAFCAHELRRFIELSEPRLILTLGIDAFTRHATGIETIFMDRNRKRTLLATGSIYGCNAVGILHPTGAYVAAEDWAKVSGWFKANV